MYFDESDKLDIYSEDQASIMHLWGNDKLHVETVAGTKLHISSISCHDSGNIIINVEVPVDEGELKFGEK